MRRMTRFVHGTTGSVSIFLLVIIFCFVSLGGLLIDGIRVRTAKQRLALATEAAADSVLAEYSNKLANEYGILAYSGEEEESKARVKGVVEAYTSGAADTFNIVTLEEVEVTLATENLLNPTVNPKILEDQLLESAKYTGVYTLGKGMLETLDFLSKSEDAMVNFSEMVDKQDELKKLVEERNKALKDIEKKTGKLQELENEIEKNAIKLDMGTIKRECAQSCLEEMLVGSGTKDWGPLQLGLNWLRETKGIYEDAGDTEKAAEYAAHISVMEFIIGSVKEIDAAGTERVKDLLKTFNEESEKTDQTLDELDKAIDKIKEAREKNKKISDIIGELKETDETKDLMASLKSIIMEDKEFSDMEQKLLSVKENYEKYAANVKIIERNLREVIDGTAKIARPGFEYTYTSFLDPDEATSDQFQKALERDMEDFMVHMAGTIMSKFSGILSAYAGAVGKGKNCKFEGMTDEITKVYQWAKDKEYKEELDEGQKQAQEQYQAEANASFTELLDFINNIQGVAEDQVVYNRLHEIVATMQDSSGDITKLDATSQEDMYEQSNNLLKKLLAGILNLRDKGLINEYLLNEVGSKQPRDLLTDLTGNMQFKNKKLEFVIYGKYVSGVNYGLSLTEIALTRMVMNAIGAVKDPVVASFKVFPLAYLKMVLLYSVIHTVKDIIILGKSDKESRENRSVALIPNILEKVKWTYKDHLRFILLYHRRGGQYERLVAVMENDTDVEGVASKPTQVRIESSAKVKLWFLPGITKSLASQGGAISPSELQLRTIKYASY